MTNNEQIKNIQDKLNYNQQELEKATRENGGSFIIEYYQNEINKLKKMLDELTGTGEVLVEDISVDRSLTDEEVELQNRINYNKSELEKAIRENSGSFIVEYYQDEINKLTKELNSIMGSNVVISNNVPEVLDDTLENVVSNNNVNVENLVNITSEEAQLIKKELEYNQKELENAISQNQSAYIVDYYKNKIDELNKKMGNALEIETIDKLGQNTLDEEVQTIRRELEYNQKELEKAVSQSQGDIIVEHYKNKVNELRKELNDTKGNEIVEQSNVVPEVLDTLEVDGISNETPIIENLNQDNVVESSEASEVRTTGESDVSNDVNNENSLNITVEEVKSNHAFYVVENGKVLERVSRKEVTDEDLVLRIKATEFIFNETKEESESYAFDDKGIPRKYEDFSKDYERNFAENVNYINNIKYKSNGKDILSKILSNKSRVKKTLILKAETEKDAIKEIIDNNLPESILFGDKLDTSLALLKLKFRENELDINELDVKLKHIEDGKWELNVAYKVEGLEEEIVDLPKEVEEKAPDITPIHSASGTVNLEFAKKQLEEAIKENNSPTIVEYWQEIIDRIERNNLELNNAMSNEFGDLENAIIHETEEAITREDITNKSKKVIKNMSKQEELYLDENVAIKSVITNDEFYSYTNEYVIINYKVYYKKNREIVEDEETILKVKAAYLIKALANQDVIEKTGEIPTYITENVLNHYLRIFSREVMLDNSINNTINAILNSNQYNSIDWLPKKDISIEEQIIANGKVDFQIFIPPILDYTKSILKLLYMQKGIVLEDIDVKFDYTNDVSTQIDNDKFNQISIKVNSKIKELIEENKFDEIIDDYKLDDVNGKELEIEKRLEQKVLYSFEDIVNYAKTYNLSNGKLWFRDNGLEETNRFNIMNVMAAKLIFNNAVAIKKSTNLSMDAAVGEAYASILNNYVINDILNSKDRVFYDLDDLYADSNIMLFLNNKNYPYLVSYIQTQLKEYGYTIDGFKCNASKKDGKIRFNVEYEKYLDEDLRKYNEATYDEKVMREKNSFSNMSYLSSLSVLNKCIEAAKGSWSLEEWNNLDLVNKKNFIRMQISNANSIDVLRLENKVKVIDLMIYANTLTELTEIRRDALNKGDQLSLQYAEVNILKIYNENSIDLDNYFSEDDFTLFNDPEKEAVLSLIKHIKQIMHNNNFVFEVNDEAIEEEVKKQGIKEKIIDVYNALKYPTKNYIDENDESVDLYIAIDEFRDKINKKTIKYSDLVNFIAYLGSVKTQAEEENRPELIQEIEAFEVDIHALIAYCDSLYYKNKKGEYISVSDIDDIAIPKIISNADNCELKEQTTKKIKPRGRASKSKKVVNEEVVKEKVEPKDIIKQMKIMLKSLDKSMAAFEIPCEESLSL